MKDRPTSVTVFVIINLILAGLGVIHAIVWVLSKAGLHLQSSEGNPVMKMMENSQGFQLFSNIFSALGIVVIILLISASIGMLSLKPWSRLVTIGWGLYSILATILGVTVTYFLVFGPMIANTTGSEHVAMVVASIVQVVFGLLFIGYYLLMIIMLSRPVVVDAFTPEPMDDDFCDWDTQPTAGGSEH